LDVDEGIKFLDFKLRLEKMLLLFKQIFLLLDSVS
jgi:hypothetical protein